MSDWGDGRTEPEILEEEISAQTAVLRLRVPADLLQFQGHFPDHPVLPGVAQLDWAVGFARRCFGLGMPVRQVQQLKFKSLVPPGTVMQLTLHRTGDGISFLYQNDETVFSSGKVRLGNA
ncbi:hypothetical protein [Microbulbifer sp. S227A]|uniref:ApeI family dehydratase n=1 Tax=Microbulbifer sp. S227A TaxID=3415131 RepID=UPI003C799BA1